MSWARDYPGRGYALVIILPWAVDWHFRIQHVNDLPERTLDAPSQPMIETRSTLPCCLLGGPSDCVWQGGVDGPMFGSRCSYACALLARSMWGFYLGVFTIPFRCSRRFNLSVVRVSSLLPLSLREPLVVILQQCRPLKLVCYHGSRLLYSRIPSCRSLPSGQ
jgi:hypothetical protein